MLTLYDLHLGLKKIPHKTIKVALYSSPFLCTKNGCITQSANQFFGFLQQKNGKLINLIDF